MKKKICAFVPLWLSSLGDFARGLAHLHDAAMDDFGVDAAEAELFAHRGIHEFHCLNTKARNEFLTACVRQRADFEHHRSYCQV